MRTFRHILIFAAFGLIGALTMAQNPQLESLEKRRKELSQEIRQINTLLFQNKKKQASVLSFVEDLNYKVRVRQNLIAITNQQANLLTREINANQNTITKLRDRLKLLKEEYAAMIVKSYKSKSEQNRVMFLLSASDFQQAYRRLQYIKQYANYRKTQGEEIKKQTAKLQALNIQLNAQKKEKQALIAENRSAKLELEKELSEQRELVNTINKDLRNYTAQIRSKQQEVDRLDKEIERVIREAMARSNEKAGRSTSSKSFALTPEDKALAASFTANKGKLPWPVEQGVVKVRYGTQRHPIVRTATIKSNGVRIATNPNERVRAVFKGTVRSIITPKNGNFTVLIQHGNYFTVYKNLSQIFVKKGDQVDTKQDLGVVLTNTANGESILSFSIFKETNTQDPALWIYRM